LVILLFSFWGNLLNYFTMLTNGIGASPSICTGSLPSNFCTASYWGSIGRQGAITDFHALGFGLRSDDTLLGLFLDLHCFVFLLLGGLYRSDFGLNGILELVGEVDVGQREGQHLNGILGQPSRLTLLGYAGLEGGERSISQKTE
jgi:hypothetical protein